MLNESGFMFFQVEAILHSTCHKNRKDIYERERDNFLREIYMMNFKKDVYFC